MGIAWCIAGIVLLWYCVRVIRQNPEHPNSARAFVLALFWPLSLFLADTSGKRSEEKADPTL